MKGIRCTGGEPNGQTSSRTTLLKLACLVASVAPLAGCAVGPDFIAPDAPVAPQYLEARSAALDTHRVRDRDWWTVFRDPVLNRLVQIAYDQNLTLLAAGTRVVAARAQLGIAVGELYPQQQNISGGLTNNRQSQADPAANPTRPLLNYWQSGLGIQAAWELDFWGKFRRGVESADAAYLATIASYDDVLVTLVADVANTYIGIRTLEAQIALARENIRRQKEALAIARDKVAGGTATNLDVFQAENVLGQTEATIPQLTIQMQQGLNALRVLLGMPPQSMQALLGRPNGRIPTAPAKIGVGMPADLIRRRPDVRAAELRAAAQSAQIGVAAADLYPAISLTGKLGGLASTANGHNLGELFTSTGLAYSLGPSFQWNILNYGQITNNVRLQDARLQQYLVEYQNTVLKAQADVEIGIATFLQSRLQAEILRRSASAAKAAVDTALLQYQQGTRDFTTVLTAEQNLLQAENNLALASGNVPKGLVAVYRALGGGWQIRGSNEFVNAATRDEMRRRTDWGDVLPTPDQNSPTEPGLPGPADIGPTVRPPEW